MTRSKNKFTTVQMIKNRLYYLEVLHSDAVGKDFFDLMVKLPGSLIFNFIPTDYLIAYMPGKKKIN
jgi:hypothetical protein